jgi:hypothetical protein
VDAYLAGLGRGQLAIAATRRPGTRMADGTRHSGSTGNMGRWPLTVSADRTVTMDFLDTRIPAAHLDRPELVSLTDASFAETPPSRAPQPQDVPVGRHRMRRRQPVA